MDRCEHLKFDSDGDYCDIGMGYGVNSHCHLKVEGGMCAFYSPKKDKTLSKFKSKEDLLKAYESLEKDFTKKCQRVKELEKKLEETVAEPPEIDIKPKTFRDGVKYATDRLSAWLRERVCYNDVKDKYYIPLTLNDISEYDDMVKIITEVRND